MQRIKVIVKPRSRLNRCQPTLEKGVYLVRVTPPAREGKANKALIEVVSRCFHLSPSKVLLTKGATKRVKEITLLD